MEFVIPHSELLSPPLVHELQAAEKKILVWTVNRAGEMIRFQKLGVDGIISDDTALLCRTVKDLQAL